MAQSTKSADSGPPPPVVTLTIEPELHLGLSDHGLKINDRNKGGVEDSDGIFCCCPPLWKGSSSTEDPTEPIPYYDILWAEHSIETSNISISHIYRLSTKPHSDAKVRTLNFLAPKLDPNEAGAFITKLLNKAYGTSKQQKRIKVLVNPFGGTGNAQSLFTKSIEPVFKAAKCKIDVVPTTHQGHAEELAEDLDMDAWDVVACCSGDGVPHEVFNGLAKQAHPQKALGKIAVAQLPCGSGNGMSWNCFGTDSPGLAALGMIKGIPTAMDLVSITQVDEEGNVVRKLSFLSQAVGIIAECDLGTENMRWMGSTRFTVGYVIRLMRQTLWPVDVAVAVEIPDRKDIKAAYHEYKRTNKSLVQDEEHLSDDTELPPLKYGTISDPLPSGWTMTPYENLGNFYAGNMSIMTENTNVFPTSMPADGCMDLLTVDGNIPRLRAMAMADITATGGLIDADDAKYQKISGYRIVPREKEGYISIDGERFPFGAFQAEVHKGLGLVLTKTGVMWEAKGPDEEK